jgi:hypothetical protein
MTVLRIQEDPGHNPDPACFTSLLGDLNPEIKLNTRTNSHAK